MTNMSQSLLFPSTAFSVTFRSALSTTWQADLRRAKRLWLSHGKEWQCSRKTNNAHTYAQTVTCTSPHFCMSSLTIHSKSKVIPCLFPVVSRVCVPAAVGIFTANKWNSFPPPTAEISQWKETCPCRRGGLISGASFCFYFSPFPDGWMDGFGSAEGKRETQSRWK